METQQRRSAGHAAGSVIWRKPAFAPLATAITSTCCRHSAPTAIGGFRQIVPPDDRSRSTDQLQGQPCQDRHSSAQQRQYAAFQTGRAVTDGQCCSASPGLFRRPQDQWLPATPDVGLLTIRLRSSPGKSPAAQATQSKKPSCSRSARS